MFAAIGTACGAGKILGLDRAALGNAISIAITSGVPLGVTRIGELRRCGKGVRRPPRNRTGVFAAELAAEGMTGPGHPFEGRDGLWQHLSMEAPKWERFGGGGEPFQDHRPPASRRTRPSSTRRDHQASSRARRQVAGRRSSRCASRRTPKRCGAPRPKRRNGIPDAGDGGPQHALPGGGRAPGRQRHAGDVRAVADQDPALRPLMTS